MENTKYIRGMAPEWDACVHDAAYCQLLVADCRDAVPLRCHTQVSEISHTTYDWSNSGICSF